MITDKAKDTTYTFKPIPKHRFRNNYGIYLHVPFCYSFCNFCPYYKEKLNIEKKKLYIKALLKEIEQRDMAPLPKWAYIGGGTPNTLAATEIALIINSLKQKTKVENIGMELIPTHLDESYLDCLKKAGVKKLSLGVETFADDILKKSSRPANKLTRIKELTAYIHKIGLWINIDLMLGFENQKIYTFRQDIESMLEIHPNQITIYPVMTIRGTKINYKTVDDKIEFELIEEANRIFKKNGYLRKTLWTFGCDDGLYDSSYDELGSDYIGLGPSGISSTRNWICVNLPLAGYIKNLQNNEKQKGFVNHHVKISAHEPWRKFGMMLYERKLRTAGYFPFYLNLFIRILNITGYAWWGNLTKKGIMYCHNLTKTVVETKSFPIQYPGCVENYNEYLKYIESNNS